jgi:hypothetical protein
MLINLRCSVVISYKLGFKSIHLGIRQQSSRVRGEGGARAGLRVSRDLRLGRGYQQELESAMTMNQFFTYNSTFLSPVSGSFSSL